MTFRGPFNRPNLYFEVRGKEKGKDAQLHQISQYLHRIYGSNQSNHTNTTTTTMNKNSNINQQHHIKPSICGIIYCLTQGDTETLADHLREEGFRADYYHAGQGKIERSTIQGRWQDGSVDIVCATIAYGMGIDKENVRFVIHATVSKSLEGYYQEAGRAGRDGHPAHCLIFYRKEDIGKIRGIMSLGIGKRRRKKLSQRDEQQLSNMTDYCENKENRCRRVLLASHFQTEAYGFRGGGIGESMVCHGTCDVCCMQRHGYNNNSNNDSIEETNRHIGNRWRCELLVRDFIQQQNQQNQQNRLPPNIQVQTKVKRTWNEMHTQTQKQKKQKKQKKSEQREEIKFDDEEDEFVFV